LICSSVVDLGRRKLYQNNTGISLMNLVPTQPGWIGTNAVTRVSSLLLAL